MLDRNSSRILRKKRIRVKGTAQCPRVVVFRSNKNLYFQAINDEQKAVLASVSTLKQKEEDLAASLAEALGKKKIKKIVFDRAGYKYHGKIKKVAEGLRKAGLEF